ncbi:MAG: hypothetical protein BIFFINMI_03105 [Phycisphaerae bacterium]|nr:hypothetical protein [Phycisphaerae bacterium]
MAVTLSAVYTLCLLALSAVDAPATQPADAARAPTSQPDISNSPLLLARRYLSVPAGLMSGAVGKALNLAPGQYEGELAIDAPGGGVTVPVGFRIDQTGAADRVAGLYQGLLFLLERTPGDEVSLSAANLQWVSGVDGGKGGDWVGGKVIVHLPAGAIRLASPRLKAAEEPEQFTTSDGLLRVGPGRVVLSDPQMQATVALKFHPFKPPGRDLKAPPAPEGKSVLEFRKLEISGGLLQADAPVRGSFDVGYRAADIRIDAAGKFSIRFVLSADGNGIAKAGGAVELAGLTVWSRDGQDRWGVTSLESPLSIKADLTAKDLEDLSTSPEAIRARVMGSVPGLGPPGQSPPPAPAPATP